MIRNVIIMATSGVVLFSKEFLNSVSQPRLIGSLLTAMLEFTLQTTGMMVNYIELSTVTVTIVIHEAAKIFCALFHDRETGSAFGRLLCTEILNAFVQDYSSDLSHFGRNLKDFHGFHSRIPDVVKVAVKHVLAQIQTQKGVLKALLVSDGGLIFSTKSDFDQLGLLANLPVLIGQCTDIMAAMDDSCNHAMLDSGSSTCLMLWKCACFTQVYHYLCGDIDSSMDSKLVYTLKKRSR